MTTIDTILSRLTAVGDPDLYRAMSGYERQMRWRAKNREKYNSYMRAYRKRKK